MLNKKIAIIIPTFREAKNLNPLLKQIFALKINGSVIIVDDNSQDKTPEIIKIWQKKHPQLKLITRAKKTGRGSAVLAGLKYAVDHTQSNYFIEMDADLSHPVQQIPQLINACNKNTCVIASRYTSHGKNLVHSFWRKVLSFSANQLIRFYLQTNLNDNTNGFRCYPKKAIEIMLKHHYCTTGYITLSETLVLLKKNHFQFKEIPTIFIDRTLGKSNTNFQEVWQAFRHLKMIKNLSNMSK